MNIYLLEKKRNELIKKLFKEGYASKDLTIIFNKHILDIEKILENNK